MHQDFISPHITERGLRLALIFALAAEGLHHHYEHGQVPNRRQASQQAAEWLQRSRRSLPQEERLHLADLAQALVTQISGSVSREAGLYISHEMMEALDPKYHSELAASLMQECERLLDQAQGS
jgi:hypothetical protein